MLTSAPYSISKSTISIFPFCEAKIENSYLIVCQNRARIPICNAVQSLFCLAFTSTLFFKSISTISLNPASEAKKKKNDHFSSVIK
jgi:hypothetical protein